ncbi:KRAB-A domain-containing protein 2-like [Diorhabda carinulata]|uniref:KRAB-A domain-containing protein 2-like n=1 Tax=Diorhabda carinulata TaxID=1163345 RepID=UPI0025A1BD67|nr:KRAB-A domain-containing protein 2-like [Diorhabda carinulata]
MPDSKEQVFREKLNLERSASKVNSLVLSKLKYDSYIEKVTSLKTSSKKENNDLRFLRRYDIIEVSGITKLIHPVTDQENIKYYVFDEELFGVLNEAHISTGHGGRDRMIEQLKGKFQNVTTKDILLFLRLCEPCIQKLNHKKKGRLVVKLLLFKEVKSRCQVDLIDFQSQSDRDFQFIMVY